MNHPKREGEKKNETYRHASCSESARERNRLRAEISHCLLESKFGSDELLRLARSGEETLAIVKDIIIMNRDMLDDADLVEKISREILEDIENEVDSHLRDYSKFTLNAFQAGRNNAQSSGSRFFNLISLLRDVSVLGRKLLEAAARFDSLRPQMVYESPSTTGHKVVEQHGDNKSTTSLSKEDTTSDDLLAALIESSSSDDFLVLSSSLDSICLREMILAVYILIKSHECFTLSHDIQGVVIVLRRTKFMILNILAPKNQMELIIKLLTSIGRYREMNYVFDLFRDRNQFEILLSKGVDRTPELRIAMFNYVKRNPEFYALVTLNFSMFREIAESLEVSALKRLDRLISSHESGDQNKLDRNQQQQQQQQVHLKLQGRKEKKISCASISGVGCGVCGVCGTDGLGCTDRKSVV